MNNGYTDGKNPQKTRFGNQQIKIKEYKKTCVKLCNLNISSSCLYIFCLSMSSLKVSDLNWIFKLKIFGNWKKSKIFRIHYCNNNLRGHRFNTRIMLTVLRNFHVIFLMFDTFMLCYNKDLELFNHAFYRKVQSIWLKISSKDLKNIFFPSLQHDSLFCR